MAILIVKIVFVILACVSGYVTVQNMSGDPTTAQTMNGMAVGLGVAAVLIALETILRKFFLDAVAGIVFGVTAGFVLAFIVLQALDLIVNDQGMLANLRIPVILVCCYVVVAIVLQTKDKFKFIIPYLDFRSSSTVPDYLILDTSAVIDGRVFHLIKLGLFPEKIIIPQFVVDELQTLSDGRDRLKRERGKRALTAVQRIRDDQTISVEVYADPVPAAEGVDKKLIRLAQKLNGRVLTTDANLVKVAAIDGVRAVNVHELATAFRPEFLPGDEIAVDIIKPGEAGKRQGVGFLGDGTMVVVEEAEKRIGDTIGGEVTNVVQTSTGKMVFARIRG
ncbi:MAG: hypothetical protein ABIF71_03985 [Planctomycetota bacterium]